MKLTQKIFQLFIINFFVGFPAANHIGAAAKLTDNFRYGKNTAVIYRFNVAIAKFNRQEYFTFV